MDNDDTHKHPEVIAWLADNPPWTFQFTPTSYAWLNVVEGFFSKITRPAIRRGVFRSVDDLVATIDQDSVFTTEAWEAENTMIRIFKPWVWLLLSVRENIACDDFASLLADYG